MTLDPQSRAFLDRINAQAPAAPYVLDARAMRLAERSMIPPPGPARAVLRGVEDRVIPGAETTLPIRLYTPHAAHGGLLVFFHGGGFVLGNLDTHDAMCCELAHGSGCIVAAVDYRLAPEHPFPAPMRDGDAAMRWIGEHAAELGADPARIGVGGDSAGGRIAANVALMARDRGEPALAFQLLLYPVTHERTRTPSQNEFAEGYFLTERLMHWFRAQYRPELEPDYPYRAPYDAADHRGLPPALIITAGHDPLRDQGAEYAARLREAGNAVAYRCYDSTIHGFMSFAHEIEAGAEALRFAARGLRAALAPSGLT